MTSRQLLGRLLAWGLAAAGLAFVALTVARQWPELRRFDWQPNPKVLAASVVTQMAALAWGVFVWSKVVARTGGEIAYPALLRVWALSNLARYVPGSVWQLVSTAQLAHSEGLTRIQALASLAVHMGFVLLAAVLTATVALPAAFLGGAARWLVLVAAAPLLLVHPAILGVGLRLFGRLTRAPALRWRGGWLDALGLLALTFIGWILSGCGFALFIAGVVRVPGSAFLPLEGVNALSFLAGYIVLFAPAGLGPREAAMTFLLTPLVPVGVAAAIAIAARLWSIAAELGTAVIALAWRRLPPRSTTMVETVP